jgi:glycosyltransferase involved in cell wall biosynthesis
MTNDDDVGPADLAAALPTLAIVVPCYDSGPLVLDAVDSARAQTYPSIEITVVDDGSRDRATLRALERLPVGVRLIRQSNAGPSAARNAAIAATDAEFVLPLDADDRLRPRAAELGAHHLRVDPDVGVVAGAMALIGDARGEHACAYSGPESMLRHTTIPNISAFRRADWLAVGGYPESVRRGEDWAFWMRILRLGRRVVVVPEVFYEYRISDDQTSGRVEPIAIAAGANLVLDENRDLYAQHPGIVIDELIATRAMLAQFRRTYGWQERTRAVLRRRLRR